VFSDLLQILQIVIELTTRLTVAAWTEGSSWHAATLDRLRRNRDRVAEWARPLGHHRPQATYLSWIDFAGTPIADDPARHILERRRVQLSPGAEFSQQTDVDTDSFARINFATNGSTLDAILAGIDRALSTDGPARRSSYS
jgi:cystathionine beta-lyase